MNLQGIFQAANVNLFVKAQKHHASLHPDNQLLPYLSNISSLIFSLISPTFIVTEFPTKIFILYRFSYFLLFLIFPTEKILVDLGSLNY